MSGKGKRSNSKAKANPRIIWLNNAYKALNKMLETKLQEKYQKEDNETFRSEANNTKILFFIHKRFCRAWLTKNKKTLKELDNIGYFTEHRDFLRVLYEKLNNDLVHSEVVKTYIDNSFTKLDFRHFEHV